MYIVLMSMMMMLINIARDFNIEKRAVIKFFFPAQQGAEENSRHSDRNIILFPSWSD